jgi:hypothetical protein
MRGGGMQGSVNFVNFKIEIFVILSHLSFLYPLENDAALLQLEIKNPCKVKNL